MKLIDLEKINLDNSLIEIITDMINRPTIDAIPVEWIKEVLKKQEYRMLLIDYIEWDSCLDWLIDKWEKENEIDKR